MIQDELNQNQLKIGKNGILLTLKVSKLTLEVLSKAIKNFIHNKRFTGEQSIKNLISSDRKLESIDLQTDLKPFTNCAKKAGINYSVLKDKKTNPPTYNVFFEGKDKAVIEKFMEGYVQDWQSGKVRTSEKTSIHEKLNKFREKIKKQAVNKDKIKEKNNKLERKER